MNRFFFTFTAILALLMLSPIHAHSERIWTHYPAELPMSDINDIAVDPADQNILWLATTTGIAKYDRSTGICTKYPIEYTIDQFYYQWAISIKVDTNGNVWAGTQGAGLMLFNGEGFSFYESADEPDDRFIREIEMDGYGTLWMVTENGMITYNGQKWHEYDETNGLPATTTFYDASIGPDNTVWLATSRGLYRYRDDEWVLFRAEQEDGPRNYFTNVDVDQNNIVWISTFQRGIVRYDGSTFTYISGDSGPYTCMDMVNNKDGSTWVGSTTGLFMYNGEDWISYTANDGLITNACQALAVIDNELLIGQNFGLSTLKNEIFSDIQLEYAPPYNKILSVASSNNTNVWVVYDNGYGIGKYDCTEWRRYTGWGFGSAKNIGIDDSGVIWISSNEGLMRYVDGNVISYQVFEDIPENRFVTQVAVSPNRTIWYSNGYNYIGFFKNESWTNIEIRQQLSCNFIYKLYVDSDNNLWVCTDQGVAMYDGNSWTLYQIGRTNDIVKDLDGYIWATAEGRVVRFDGQSWETFGSLQHVVSLVVDQNNVKWFGTYYNEIVWFDGITWQLKELNNDGNRITINDISVNNDNTIWFATTGGLWSCSDFNPVNVSGETVLLQFQLLAPFPNPFNPATTIPFIISEQQRITVDIINMQGQVVDRLTNDIFTPGRHEIRWDSTGNASGVYFCRIRSGQEQFARKMLLVK